jgi:GT2 family glycosyltransferase
MKKVAQIAVIVTVINRVGLLRKCLASLEAQTYRDFSVYVVSNGSDGSVERMISEEFPDTHTLSFREPLGSAGSYKCGLRKSYQDGAEWFWLMDDDVRPDKKALELLVKASNFDSTKTFASVDLDEKRSGDLAWYNNLLIDDTIKMAKCYKDLGTESLVESDGIGYMGSFLPRCVIEKVGYPNEKLFIWADDVDYTIRIRRAGFRQFFVRESIVYHPKADYHEFNLLGKKVYVTLGAPWREYYQIRNNIWVWSIYEGRTKTLLLKLPKQFILWMYVLFRFEDQKLKRLLYYLRAFFDGATGRLGMAMKPEYK